MSLSNPEPSSLMVESALRMRLHELLLLKNQYGSKGYWQQFWVFETR
ncbi:hypothetical protein [Nostoc sp.]